MIALDEILSDETISIISITMAQHSMKASTCSTNSIEQESLTKQLSVNVVQVELLKFLYYMTRSFMQLFFKTQHIDKLYITNSCKWHNFLNKIRQKNRTNSSKTCQKWYDFATFFLFKIMNVLRDGLWNIWDKFNYFVAYQTA